MESENVNRSNQHGKIDSGVKHEDGKPLLEGKDNLNNSSPKSGKDEHLSSDQESPDVSDQGPNWSMISATPRGISYQSEWNMQSPQVQTMERPAGYDPNRIPSSIFSSKPASAMDWSVASNESLFSIHMGNNSFSRDIFIGKSGELSTIDEWNNSPSEAKSNELNSFPTVLTPVMEVPGQEEISVRSGMGSSVTKGDHSNSMQMDQVETVDRREHVSHGGEGKGGGADTMRTSSGAPLMSPSPPRLSDESGHSGRSFAFPVLVNDGEKPDSAKAASEKPQVEPQVPEASPKASETRWFPSFSCLPRCC